MVVSIHMLYATAHNLYLSVHFILFLYLKNIVYDIYTLRQQTIKLVEETVIGPKALSGSVILSAILPYLSDDICVFFKYFSDDIYVFLKKQNTSNAQLCCVDSVNRLDIRDGYYRNFHIRNKWPSLLLLHPLLLIIVTPTSRSTNSD